MIDFIDYLVEPYLGYDTLQILLEIIAATLGIASVFYSMKRNILVFPTGIISTGLYIYLLFTWGLYGDMLINVYYTSMSIYGWILWGQATGDDSLHVNVLRMNKKEYIYGSIFLVASVLLVLAIYYYRPVIENGFDLSYVRHSGFHYKATDYIDSLLTGIFLVGMWLMARRKVESWIFWIIGDFLAIGLFIVKGYGITSIQYVVFTVLAFMAYFEWMRNLRQQESGSLAES